LKSPGGVRSGRSGGVGLRLQHSGHTVIQDNVGSPNIRLRTVFDN
jgi:hypothetical protein